MQQLEEAQQLARKLEEERKSENFYCQCPTFQACCEFSEYYLCNSGGMPKSTFDQGHNIPLQLPLEIGIAKCLEVSSCVVRSERAMPFAATGALVPT